MPCAHCVGADELFDDRIARRELRRYERRGPKRSTALLIEAVRGEGDSLLDVGGGVGAIQAELAGDVDRITGVDASHAYLEVARDLAVEHGYIDQAEQQFGDFVEVADEIPPHDIVTLDRVLCCYPHLGDLVEASATRTRRVWGVVFPKERWWARLGAWLLNLGLRIWGSDYRTWIHPEERVDRLAREQGLQPATRAATWLWNVWVYERPDEAR